MPEEDLPSSGIGRRVVLISLPAAAVAAGIWAFYPQGTAGPTLSPGEALALTEAGELLLIDIRRPDEWSRTGLAAPAYPLDMRREDFLDALAELRGERDLPIALICARGVRSRRLQGRLANAGVLGVLDIPEGMEGSRAGPGWVARDLPLREYPEANG